MKLSVVIAVFVVLIVLATAVEYLLYGALTSVFDSYLDAVPRFNKLILAIAILIIEFPLLLGGILTALSILFLI